MFLVIIFFKGERKKSHRTFSFIQQKFGFLYQDYACLWDYKNPVYQLRKHNHDPHTIRVSSLVFSQTPNSNSEENFVKRGEVECSKQWEK